MNECKGRENPGDSSNPKICYCHKTCKADEKADVFCPRWPNASSYWTTWNFSISIFFFKFFDHGFKDLFSLWFNNLILTFKQIKIYFTWGFKIIIIILCSNDNLKKLHDTWNYEDKNSITEWNLDDPGFVHWLCRLFLHCIIWYPSPFLWVIQMYTGTTGLVYELLVPCEEGYSKVRNLSAIKGDVMKNWRCIYVTIKAFIVNSLKQWQPMQPIFKKMAIATKLNHNENKNFAKLQFFSFFPSERFSPCCPGWVPKTIKNTSLYLASTVVQWQ